MGRYSGPVCRLCRREGVKLFLKGSRCEGPKCSVARREYAPGMHGWRRGKLSEYGVRLREKQKLKRFYGVLERQFRRYFEMAERAKGNTGETLLILLERRLDNIVYRLGLAPSRPAARQLVNHGEVLVNGRRTDVPSMLVKPGQTVSVHPSKREVAKSYLDAVATADLPAFMERSEDPPEGRMTRLPSRDDVSLPIQEQLIVEFCSK